MEHKNITIQELLINRMPQLEVSKVKIVRHKDVRLEILSNYVSNEFNGDDKPSIYDIYKNEKEGFLKYQRNQAKPIFDGCDYIVSFLGEEGTFARFIGVFKVEGKSIKNNGIWYDLTEVDGVFNALKEKVIIDWGKSALSWHQYFKNEKEVIEILPNGLDAPNFVEYTDFILTFPELKRIILSQNPIWKRMLSAVNGIYLICDKKHGKYYIGSTYGQNGIWQRWECYVKSEGSGHNKELVELVNKNPNHASNFTFTILAVLPKTLRPEEIIKKENLYKNKLNTRNEIFGYNAN